MCHFCLVVHVHLLHLYLSPENTGNNQAKAHDARLWAPKGGRRRFQCVHCYCEFKSNLPAAAEAFCLPQEQAEASRKAICSPQPCDDSQEI